MSAAERSDAGLEEDESTDAKIKRLAEEIDDLKASLIGVPEGSKMWFKMKKGIMDRDVERLVLLEKKRCDDVVQEYFEEKPHVLESADDCPLCFEKMWDRHRMILFDCCGKRVCLSCCNRSVGKMWNCPLCRADFVRDGIKTFIEKAEEGHAWAEFEVGVRYLCGRDPHGFDMKKDVEEGLSLLNSAVSKGFNDANHVLAEHFRQEGEEDKSRSYLEAAAEGGDMHALAKVARMKMVRGLSLQSTEEVSEAYRLITVATTLIADDTAENPLAGFVKDKPPLYLHYLRPQVENGATDKMANYALALMDITATYLGTNAIVVPGYSPIPEALFWYRRSDKDIGPRAQHLFTQFEHGIRVECAFCRAALSKGKRFSCVECKAAYYCDRNCQAAHWKAGHKKDCVKKLKKRLMEADTLVGP